jgi:hypothetical protein
LKLLYKQKINLKKNKNFYFLIRKLISLNLIYYIKNFLKFRNEKINLKRHNFYKIENKKKKN